VYPGTCRCTTHVRYYRERREQLFYIHDTHANYNFEYIRGCIYTPPVLVGLWLGSVEIQQAIYSAYEFVTCYDRCMYSCINVRVHMMYLCPKMRKPKSEVDRILKAPSHPLFQVFLEPHILLRFCSTCNVLQASKNGILNVFILYTFSFPNLTRLFLIVSNTFLCLSAHSVQQLNITSFPRS
jgi:hypothetical protein